MTDLSIEEYKACQPGDSHLSESEINLYLEQLQEWQVTEQNQIKRLKRIYLFNNFMQAIEFVNMVAELAESVNHHPRMIIEWGRASVMWWTHTIGGLHKNDFIMAKKTDGIFSSAKKTP